MDGIFNIGVHALVYLNHKNCNLSSEELAGNICTNAARVRKVMSKLKKSGLVETKEGIAGGYRFSKEAKEVSLAKVAEALDVRFVGASWHSGDMDMECLVASGMSEIMDGIYQELDEQCRKKLESITIQDIDNQIFGGK
ncbi:MAG: Rrf2 family transcriptional regulator [Hespellia sp.]|nr:Rrf2 family transcriptional regulator [Hespellia sp.]